MTGAFVVTTGITATPDTVQRAIDLSLRLKAKYVERAGSGISAILARSKASYALIVQADRLALSDGLVLYSFHPNMLLIRGLNVLRKWRDLYFDAAEFKEGESVLDCTVGFACEASLAALAVGPSGRVVGLESMPALAAVTQAGLADFKLETTALRDAMRRVVIVCADYSAYLLRAIPGSFDVVAFDPFFDAPLEGTQHAVTPLAHFGDKRPLDVDAVLRARLIARRRVIVKHPRFAQLPGDLVSMRMRLVESRKGQTAYSVFDPVDNAGDQLLETPL